MLTVVKLFFSVLSLAIALIPIGLFLLIQHSSGLEEFGQKLILYFLSLLFMWPAQLMFIILWLALISAIWKAPKLKN